MKRRAFIKQSAQCLATSLIPLQRAWADTDQPKPFVLRIHCDGGWDQTCVFDDKIDSDIVSTQSGISIASGGGGIKYLSHALRPSVDSFFSAHGDRSCIVNGLYCNGISRSQTLPFSLGMPVSGKTTFIQDFMDYYASIAAPKRIAPYLAFETPYFSGETAGKSFLINQLTREKYLSAPSNVNSLDNSSAENELDKFLDSRYESWVKGLKKGGIDYRKALALSSSRTHLADFKKAFSEAQSSTEKPADSTTLRDSKLALHLFKTGVSQAATVRAGRALEWDTVSDNYNRQSSLFENLFSDLNAVISYAVEIGIENNLIIYVTSECGRSPTLNVNQGKDRWSYTSMLAWGKFIRPATVAGRTDEYLRGVNLDPIFGTEENQETPLNIRHAFAALYLAAGIGYESFLPGVDYLSLMIKLR